MLDYVASIRQRPVWQPVPEPIANRFRVGLPTEPTELSNVYDSFSEDILPYAVGNSHPGFMGWVHGGGNVVGMLAEMLAAGLNSNLGGRDHVPIAVEQQVVQWMSELFGFPPASSGLFVTGSSIANFIAILVARTAAIGVQVRERGMRGQVERLIAYASTDAHGCIAKALEMSGIGSENLRQIAVDSHHRIRIDQLEHFIASDRAAGNTPFCVIGNAGTVDTGAIDDLSGLADVCKREELWFHVDGACGALGMMSAELAPKFKGIERADSLALDFHKWAQIPYDAGFVLIRDPQLQQATFAAPAKYLRRAQRGLAAGSPWPCDFGPDLSRNFKALKVWFTLKVYGTRRLGELMVTSCQLARYLERQIQAHPELELMAPVSLNIVCFRYRCERQVDEVNSEIVIAIQESGVAAPSSTEIDGQVAIRAALFNHRTTQLEVDTLLEATLRFGRQLKLIGEPR